jgi:hypothetical protein
MLMNPGRVQGHIAGIFLQEQRSRPLQDCVIDATAQEIRKFAHLGAFARPLVYRAVGYKKWNDPFWIGINGWLTTS